jgi:hypothetical protein
VVITGDAANIELSAAGGLLAPLTSNVLISTIPEELRSASGEWFTLSGFLAS